MSPAGWSKLPDTDFTTLARERQDMMFTARHQVIREATDIVLRRLEGLAPSEKTDQLRVWVEECLQDVEQWEAAPPTPRERDVIAKRVLAVHIEVTRLERDALGGAVMDSAATE